MICFDVREDATNTARSFARCFGCSPPVRPGLKLHPSPKPRFAADFFVGPQRLARISKDRPAHDMLRC